MKNPFFEMALSGAARMVGKPARLVRLAGQFLLHLHRTKSGKFSIADSQGKFNQLGRLAIAYATGRYRLPVKAIVSVAAALLYFLNPLDLLPDALPVLGLTDDFAVLTWVYRNLSNELSAFESWENAVAKG